MSAIKSRRAILTGAAAAMVAAPALASSPVDDPIYPIWREWRTLFELHWATLDRAVEIDNALPSEVRVPRVLVTIGKDWQGKPNGNLYYGRTPEEIRDLLGFNCTAFNITPQRIAAAEALERELEQLQAGATAEYERCGYTALCRHADDLWAKMEPLKKRMEESPSTSAVAIAAKLDLAYACTNTDEDLGDMPISYMGHILRSLWPSLPTDMQDALKRATEHDGQVYQLYEGRAQA